MDFLDSRNAMSALVGIGRIAAASACNAWGRKGITIGTGIPHLIGNDPQLPGGQLRAGTRPFLGRISFRLRIVANQGSQTCRVPRTQTVNSPCSANCECWNYLIRWSIESPDSPEMRHHAAARAASRGVLTVTEYRSASTSRFATPRSDALANDGP